MIRFLFLKKNDTDIAYELKYLGYIMGYSHKGTWQHSLENGPTVRGYKQLLFSHPGNWS